MSSPGSFSVMPMVFHGSTINTIDTDEGREFEMDGQRFETLGQAITAARAKKEAAEKAEVEKEAATPPAPVFPAPVPESVNTPEAANTPEVTNVNGNEEANSQPAS